VAQVEGLAARQSVLMLFEDAQWIDPTSLELLDLIIDRAPALPLLLIITFRPEFTAPWIGRPHVTSLGLNRLAQRERAEMIAGITGGKALPQDIADQIIDRTDGVPLFVEELTKAVVESGVLTDAGDRYMGPAAPLTIPASLQASLLARLDRLAPVREVAQIGAASLLSALFGQFIYHWARAELRRARQLAEEMVGLGEDSGDLPTRALACNAGALACFQTGEFTAGRAYAEKGLALYDPAHRLADDDTLVQLHTRSSWLLACLGHLGQALFQRDVALDEARRLSHPPTLALALVSAWLTACSVHLEPGSFLQYADELLAVATEHGLAHYRSAALIQRGSCLAASGHADEGIPLLLTGLAGWEEQGFMLWRPFIFAQLGDVSRAAGQWQAALDHFARARRLAEETEERWFQAETVRLTGDVLLAMGDRANAEASYCEAMAIAQQQSAKIWELRAATSLARLWRDQGKRIEARDLLAPVYGWFAEGFGTPVLQEAKALLDELA
jgi:tetratricopeptide (TPR) repeat protein